jgi:hypothetical protein
VLPSDYKELCERFGPGLFSEYIEVAPTDGKYSISYWYHVFKKAGATVEPYGPYEATGRHGLLLWGTSEHADRFMWLADATEDPDNWPIIAISAPEQYRFDISISEFIYKVLTDPEFEPYGIPDPNWPRTFERRAF